MLSVLRDRTYRHLFTAQVVALVGTGLATVALGLLAYDRAGDRASAVLGTALAIKMVAYVAVAPLAGAVAARVPRRSLMVAADLTRAGVALALPFVGQIWQIYVLVFLLQAASATFTPVFQATIPEVLPAERDYTRALSLSRLAYDLESLFSPALAAGLLTLVSSDRLFAGTAIGFLASAALVVSVALPGPAAPAGPPASGCAGALGRTGAVRAEVALGARLFWAAPRLRALLALDLAVAAGGALVFVHSVVLVRDHFHRPAGDLSLALGAYGAGSVLTALLLPRLLRRFHDRAVMLPAAFALPVILAAVAALGAVAPGAGAWVGFLAAWAAIGAACSAVLTPGGRVIRRCVGDAELPAAFAAQFSLSHACWLLTYPLAGLLATGAGLPVAALVLGALALTAAVAATVVWPAREPVRIERVHADRDRRPQPSHPPHK
ncbi:MFS transporter [Streptomyces sp. NPDC050509]|uniref:MFS transporter n=1 Tax=Streptomyces sp. NPDC050509 TaxID=3365620 RepID=UPI0037B474BF